MPGQHLARVDQSSAPDGAGLFYTLSDRLGSVRDVINASGTVEDSVAYDNIVSGNAQPTYLGRYAWTGQETDLQTGLQYSNARWYSPATGTWMSRAFLR